MDKNLDVSECLSIEFRERIQKNRHYSLRRFASSLDLPVATLSMIMSGKSYPKVTTIKSIARQLNWSQDHVEELIRIRDSKILAKRKRTHARKRIEPDFDLLENLIPLALLAIANTRQAESSIESLSAILGVSQAGDR